MSPRRTAAVVATVLIGAVMVALIAVGFATATDAIPGDPRQSKSATMQDTSQLAQARMECGTDYGSEGELTQENDGQVTLVYAGSPGAYEDYTDVLAETEAALCVLDEIDAPQSVLARLGNTRALDGMQDAQWGDYAASWTYHPDDGLNLIITEG